MTAANFNACLAAVLNEEKPSDDPPCRLGVTRDAWQTWVGVNRVVTAADILALTVADVTPLYRVFWRGCGADYLPDGVDLATFDWCINSGVRDGNKGLQKALGVSVDGLVGPETLNAATNGDHAAIIGRVSELRADLYRGQGYWLDRIGHIHAAAHDMIAG
jgi:lysozyme family protein